MAKNIFKDFLLSRRSLTDKLLDEISDYDIYCELIGYEVPIGKPIISPIRLDDDVPSFSLFIPTKVGDVREEELWWRDFRDGYGNVFKFVQRFAKIHYGAILETRKDIIEFIDNILNLGILKGNVVKYEKRKIDFEKLKETRDILFTSRPYTQRDLIWWANYGIDELLLKRYDVRSIRYLLDEQFNITKKISIYNLAFAYVIYDKVKIYMPEADPTRKWRNSCPSEYIQGWQQLEGKDVIIVTKSLKDIMVFKSFMNIDVVAPQSESAGFTKDQMAKMKSDYRLRYVVYDYDTAGRLGADKMEEHGFLKRFVSEEVNPKTGKPDDKDISDFVQNHSFLETIERLEQMFPELDESYFRYERVEELSNLLKSLTDE